MRHALTFSLDVFLEAVVRSKYFAHRNAYDGGMYGKGSRGAVLK